MLKQQAIIFTRDNVEFVCNSLIDYTDPFVLAAEYEHLFNTNRTLVLVRTVMADGQAVLGYVVTNTMLPMHVRPVAPLNETAFVDVEPI